MYDATLPLAASGRLSALCKQALAERTHCTVPSTRLPRLQKKSMKDREGEAMSYSKVKKLKSHGY